jgi:hypothetical protein
VRILVVEDEAKVAGALKEGKGDELKTASERLD